LNAQEQTYPTLQEHRIAGLATISAIGVTSVTIGVTIEVTIRVTIGVEEFGDTSAEIGVTIAIVAFGVTIATHA
jgi:hypothetical protein